jgi:hypothetical protein
LDSHATLINSGESAVKIKYVTAAIILALVCAVSVLLTSCAHGPTKETLEAVMALKKIQAATQVGVSYQQYGLLLIEAKAKTNEATAALPDGALKTDLTTTMDSYADAGTVWGIKIQRYSLHDDGSEPDKSLIAKYQIPVAPDKYTKRFAVDADDALQIIWRRADTHLAEVSKLVGQEPVKP